MVDESVEFYKIVTDCGEKYIEPICNYYYAGDNPPTPGRKAYYDCSIKLSDFLAMEEWERQDWLSESVRWVGDFSDEAVQEAYDNSTHEFPNELSFADLTMDTPLGYYHGVLR